MNASSQNSEALPSELSPVPPPMPDALRDAYAAYGAVFPVPAGSPAAAPEEAPTKVTTLQAAAAVMDAEMKKNGTATGEDLAEAERTAGILFDAAHVEAVRTAALEQARTEFAAELRERGEQLAVMTDFKHRLDAVMRLCEGRPGDHAMLVREILAAALNGSTPRDDIPLTVAWARRAHIPQPGDAEQRAIVEGVTAHGGRADLVLNRDERLALAQLLDLEVRDINKPCPTEGCGTVDEYDASDPAMFGWSRLEVAGSDDSGPRWYCSDMCVFDALARAGHELAEDDRRAELDGEL